MYKNYIKEIALAKGIKIKQMAEDLGITRQSLSYRINRKSCNISSLVEIADYLGVELWELFKNPYKDVEPIVCPHCGCIVNEEDVKMFNPMALKR